MARSRRTAQHRMQRELEHRGWDHAKVRRLDIRSGDTVVVLAGKDKGKRGTVDRTVPERQRIVVRGVNTLKRHTKAGVKGAMQGGIVDFDAAIAYSNVQWVCPKCDKPARIGHQVDDNGNAQIVCKKCGEAHTRGKAS